MIIQISYRSMMTSLLPSRQYPLDVMTQPEPTLSCAGKPTTEDIPLKRKIEYSLQRMSHLSERTAIQESPVSVGVLYYSVLPMTLIQVG